MPSEDLKFEIEKHRRASDAQGDTGEEPPTKEDLQRRPNLWLLAVAAWMLLAFANDMVRSFATELNGVIVSYRDVHKPMEYAMLYQGPTALLDFARGRRTILAVVTEYKIQGADGHIETFLPGPTCSFLSSGAEIGSRIQKQAGHWIYEVNGRPFSELPFVAIPDRSFDDVSMCAAFGSARLVGFLVVLALGLLWCPTWKRFLLRPTWRTRWLRNSE